MIYLILDDDKGSVHQSQIIQYITDKLVAKFHEGFDDSL